MQQGICDFRLVKVTFTLFTLLSVETAFAISIIG